MPPTSRSTGLAALTAALLLVPAGAASAKDRDRDGLPDRWEKRHQVKRAGADHDADGLSNRYEFLARTLPRRKDSDGDRLPDGREDPDRDRLVNVAEVVVDWDPRDADSDGDGLRDGDEGAGTVVAVDAATVTLELLSGGRVTLAYDADTSVACEEPEIGVEDEWDAEDELWFDDEGEDEELDGEDESLEGEDVVDPDDEALEEAADACLSALQPGVVVYETEVDEWDGVAFLAYADLLGD